MNRRRLAALVILLLVAAAGWSASPVGAAAAASSCPRAKIRDGAHCIALPRLGGKLASDESVDAALDDALLADGPTAATRRALSRAFGSSAVRKWEQSLSAAEGARLADAMPWDADNARVLPEAGRRAVRVSAGGHTDSQVSIALGALGTAQGGDQRTLTTTATLGSAGGSLPAHEAKKHAPVDGPRINHIARFSQASWECPQTGPNPTEGEAQAKQIGKVKDTFTITLDRRRHIYASQTYAWELSLTVHAHADDEANLKSFAWKWELTGQGSSFSGAYTSSAPGARPGPAQVSSHGGSTLVDGEVIGAVDRWAYTEANNWAKAAFTTWNTEHRCTTLEIDEPRENLLPNIPVTEMLNKAKTKLGTVIEQLVTLDVPAGVTASPSSAKVKPGLNATFKVVNTRSGAAQDRRRRGRAADAGADEIEFDGVSDDGRSVLDVPVDYGLPIATVQAYSLQQKNTGQGPGTSGRASIAESLSDTTAQADPGFCDSDTDTCHLNLWVDRSITESGSEHKDPQQPGDEPCDETNGPTTISDPDVGLTNITLTYDSDGDLVSGNLEDAPYGPTVGNGAVIGGPAGSEGSGGEDSCDTNLWSTMPNTLWVEQPLDPTALAKGALISENFTRSGTFDLGEAGSISFTWQSGLRFKVAHAGNPPNP